MDVKTNANIADIDCDYQLFLQKCSIKVMKTMIKVG